MLAAGARDSILDRSLRAKSPKDIRLRLRDPSVVAEGVVSKKEALLNLPVPNEMTCVRRFLGERFDGIKHVPPQLKERGVPSRKMIAGVFDDHVAPGRHQRRVQP